MCQKSLVIFRCAQLLQIWISCVATGTFVWLGEAYPLGVRIGAPALSWSCWHSRLLAVSSFPESLDTHPLSANDSTPSSPTSSQIPGPSSLYFSVCWGRGGVERMGEEGRWLGCISEPPIWRVLKTHAWGLTAGSWIRCLWLKVWEAPGGWRSDRTPTAAAACTAWLS